MTRKDLPPIIREKLNGPARVLFEYLLTADSYTARHVVERFRHVPLGHDGPIELIVDRALQILRRHNLARYKRDRNGVVWSPTRRIDLAETDDT